MKVFLCVRPHNILIHYGKGSNLSPRFMGTFKILERIGPLSYHLDLPPNLSRVRHVFNISVLRRYITDPSHVLDWTALQVQEQG